MIDLLQKVPLDRALLVIFLAGQLYQQFKQTRASLRDQGRRMGTAETAISALEARVTALEASGKRG